MTNDPGETNRLRHYLLGGLKDDAVVAEIEMQLLGDDHFGDKMSVAENDLIEEFLDGELDKKESESFVRYFLASPERRRRLRLTKNLRDYSAKASIVPHHERSLNEWPHKHSIYRLRFVLGAVLLVAAAAGVWRFAIYRSDTDRGLAELRKAYSGSRPLEPRVTAMPDYLTYSETRGPVTNQPEQSSHDRAERYLLDAAHDTADAHSHQALALLYLTDKKYDRALQEFELALAAAPQNASVQSDAGAAHLVIAKSLDREKQGAKILESLNESLKHLNLAISLNSKLPEPRFNRALCLEALNYREQATAAWVEYLELDPGSQWAAEARRHLQALEADPAGERLADQLESDFLAAFKAGDENLASQLAGQNRELIRDKYLPSRLASSYINAPDDRRDELLSALRYEGQIELKLTGDPFANEIAHFYERVPKQKFETLRLAHDNIRKGYAYCLGHQWEQALAAFKTAQGQFAQAGDTLEAQLAQYFVAYALVNSRQPEAALVELQKVRDLARQKHYRWLEATVTYWVGTSNTILRQPTKGRIAYEQALAIAISINDQYATDRNRVELAGLLSDMGQSSRALKYLYDVVKDAQKTGTSERQRYRNLGVGFRVFESCDLHDAALANALESVAVAERSGEGIFMSEARDNVGEAFAQLENIAEARRWISDGRQKALAIDAELEQKKRLAFSDLKFGELELTDGNFDAAEQYYSDAARYFDFVDLPVNRDDAHNGLMMTYLKAGNVGELEKQIPENIRLTEEYRSRVLEEEQRTSYFDSKQNIYDIAAEFEFGRGNLEKAYNYAEMSSSRNLLDRMDSQKKTDRKLSDEMDRSPETKPLELAAIREKMPPDVQVVQYSVLNDRILIWLVSKDRFEAVSVAEGARDLEEKAVRFAKSLSRPSAGADVTTRVLGRAFYDLLILPVRNRLDAKKEICLIPSKALFNISFAALVAPDGRPAIADLTFFYSPSANTFLRSTENANRRSRKTGETLLAVGNPSFDRTRFGDLPNVEDAATEASDIAAMYRPSKVLLRPQATKKAFLNSIASAEVIHFAGHYVTAPGTPSASYLLFARNVGDPDQDTLTNGELSTVKFPKTKLVVLSACQTGIEAYYSSEGMIGMSRTLLAADVPVVVASQWNVDTGATADLMKRFHRYRLEPNVNSATALRRAQNELAADPGGRFADPYYWAGFAVFGGAANF